MALQINKEYDYKGISISSLYGRIEYTVDYKSSLIFTTVHFFINKEISKIGMEESLDLDAVKDYVAHTIEYDPTIDDNNIIALIHNKLLNILTTDDVKYSNTYYSENIPDLDSGGDPLYDELDNPIYEHLIGDAILDIDGNNVTTSIIIKHKLCEIGEIEIKDLI